jgi:hypothetical protein
MARTDSLSVALLVVLWTSILIALIMAMVVVMTN